MTSLTQTPCPQFNHFVFIYLFIFCCTFCISFVCVCAHERCASRISDRHFALSSHFYVKIWETVQIVIWFKFVRYHRNRIVGRFVWFCGDLCGGWLARIAEPAPKKRWWWWRWQKFKKRLLPMQFFANSWFQWFRACPEMEYLEFG